MFKPIRGDGNAATFDLRHVPDGIYLRDGRAIPVAHDATMGIDDGKAVVNVHGRSNNGEGLRGVVIGMDVEQRVLELVPSAK